jgi:hypothetical protein
MKFSVKQMLCLLVIIASCSSCVPVPYHAVVRPGINGFIVDAQTGQPIVGANVTMDSTLDYGWTSNKLATAHSESTTNGAFYIPPQHKWRTEPTPNFAPNDGQVECQLLIEHTNYEPFQLRLGFPDASLFGPLPLTTNLSKIYLQPLHQ